MRGLFRGEGRRFDVKRRARHCLCFVTKLPHFSLFRTLLSQIYAVTLLEKKFGSAKRILEALYEKRSFNIGSNSYLIDMNKILYSAEFLGSLPKSLLLANSSFFLQLPSTGEFAYRQDSCILPLLEVLGVERFLLILTATLLEHRIIFIADEAETLSSSLLAVSSMIYPFSWRSFFAPLLPSRLLEMTGAPYPYLLGIRRYQLPALYRHDIGDVILVDLNSGECSTRGQVNLRDIIGDSGSNVALKQASETIDMLTRTAGGLASKLMKNAFNSSSSSSATTTESSSSGGPSKDIISCCIGDLRAVLSSKPGNLSLQGITSGFLSGNIPGVSKTNLEAAKIQWELDGERQIKDCLLLFFAYLFADIDEAVNMSFLMKQKASSDSGAGKNKGGSHTAQFISQAFDFNSLLQRRATTESRAILDFLSDFRNSEMFVQFCDNKLMRILTTDKSSSRPPAAHETVGMGDNLFEAVREELRGKRPSIPLVKQTIATLRAYQDQVNTSQDALDTGSRLKSTLLHILTVQLTGGSIGDNAARRAPGDESTADSPIVRLSGKGASDSPWDQAVVTICADTYQSDAVSKIMKTIALRLVCCKAAGNKGSAGLAGKRALILLRSLLVDGCESVLAFALDLVPVLRGIIRLLVGRKQEDEARSASSSAQPFDMLSLSTNYSSDIVPFARVVLRLIVDHNLLALQRQFSFQARSGVFPYKTSSARNELWSAFARDKYTLPSFVACHNRFRPPAECNFAPDVFAYNLAKT